MRHVRQVSFFSLNGMCDRKDLLIHAPACDMSHIPFREKKETCLQNMVSFIGSFAKETYKFYRSLITISRYVTHSIQGKEGDLSLITSRGLYEQVRLLSKEGACMNNSIEIIYM